MNTILVAISKWMMLIFKEMDTVIVYQDISLLDLNGIFILLGMIYAFIMTFLMPSTGSMKESGKGIFSKISSNHKSSSSAQAMGMKQLNSNQRFGNK